MFRSNVSQIKASPSFLGLQLFSTALNPPSYFLQLRRARLLASALNQLSKSPDAKFISEYLALRRKQNSSICILDRSLDLGLNLDAPGYSFRRLFIGLKGICIYEQPETTSMKFRKLSGWALRHCLREQTQEETFCLEDYLEPIKSKLQDCKKKILAG